LEGNTLLGHLVIDREILPNPSMASKNTVAYPGVWNLCQLSENDFELQKDKKSQKDLQAIV